MGHRSLRASTKTRPAAARHDRSHPFAVTRNLPPIFILVKVVTINSNKNNHKTLIIIPTRRIIPIPYLPDRNKIPNDIQLHAGSSERITSPPIAVLNLVRCPNMTFAPGYSHKNGGKALKQKRTTRWPSSWCLPRFTSFLQPAEARLSFCSRASCGKPSANRRMPGITECQWSPKQAGYRE